MISNQEGFPYFEKLISEAPEVEAAVIATPDAPTGPVMSSLKIAEATGKNHADVLRDIRNVLGEAGIGESKFAGTYTDSQNKERACYFLPRRECDLVVSGYSVKYRLAIIDRWQELEAKQTFKIPQTLGEALRLAADLQDQVQIMAPKAEALDLIACTDGLMNITTAAKTLQIGPRVLAKYLDSNGWTYRRVGNVERVPYQSKISQGLMTMKAFRYTNEKTGEDHVAERSLITAKGLAKLAEIFGKSQAA